MDGCSRSKFGASTILSALRLHDRFVYIWSQPLPQVSIRLPSKIYEAIRNDPHWIRPARVASESIFVAFNITFVAEAGELLGQGLLTPGASFATPETSKIHFLGLADPR
jgi:hypothetical protein